MKERFVTYDIALIVRELGFDEPCFGYFDISTKVLYFADKSEYYLSKQLPSIIIAAPLWQQVIDWFREEHHIIIKIEFDVLLNVNRTLKSYFIIRDLDSIDSPFDSRGKFRNQFYVDLSYTRKQAILKAIELCKKK